MIWLAPAVLIVLAALLWPRSGELSAFDRRTRANRERSADVIPISRAKGWRTGL